MADGAEVGARDETEDKGEDLEEGREACREGDREECRRDCGKGDGREVSSPSSDAKPGSPFAILVAVPSGDELDSFLRINSGIGVFSAVERAWLRAAAALIDDCGWSWRLDGGRSPFDEDGFLAVEMPSSGGLGDCRREKLDESVDAGDGGRAW